MENDLIPSELDVLKESLGNTLDVVGTPDLAPIPANQALDPLTALIQPSAPSEELPPAAAPVATVLAPEVVPPPEDMISQKVGSDSTTTTYRTQSPETAAAVSDLVAAGDMAKAAELAKADSDIKVAELEAKRDSELSSEISKIKEAQAAGIQKAKLEAETAVQEYVTTAKLLAQEKPETFWGSKSAADVVMASIAVGLGAYGQALTGSGQNIGMVLLERQMSEFEKQQEVQRQNKIKQIETMKASVDDKVKLLDRVNLEYDAKVAAAGEKIKSQYAQILQMAKTPGTQAAAQKNIAAIDERLAAKQIEIAQKYESETTKRAERDVFEQIKNTSNTRDGKPLTEGQTKARMAFGDMYEADKQLLAAGGDNIVSSPGYNAAVARNNFANLGYGGATIGTFANALTGYTPSKSLVGSGYEKEAAYYDAARAWTRAAIRFKSGANIPVREEGDEFKTYFAQPGDTPEITANKAKLREALAKSMRDAANLR